MLQSLIEKRLLIPSIMVLVMLPVLVGLGLWQLDRLAWKERLIADLVSRAQSAPVPIEMLLDAEGALKTSAADLEYTAVVAKGRFLHDKEARIYAPDPRKGPGVEIVTPFALLGSDLVLLVDRGYVPDGAADPTSRLEGQVAGDVELVGLVRAPGAAGTFSLPQDERSGLWFWRDFDGMIGAAFGSAPPRTLRLFLDARDPAPGGLPSGGATRFDIPNRHFEYALTWFGLAAALLFVFFFYVVSRLRSETA
ncbi:MAG: SURF1 family protein [Hyphomicrobium sp.]|nr:SURF1 family protein [Hyphomicrobium sp.]